MNDLAKVTAGNKFITLKVAVKTRWWTELTMLDSIFANEKTFNTMVTLDKAPASVKKLNWPKMRLMAVVLRPFADAAKMLEGEKYPTGGLVASTVGFLRKTLVRMLEHEDETIQGASKAALADVDQR